jgi:hypothetical protein
MQNGWDLDLPWNYFAIEKFMEWVHNSVDRLGLGARWIGEAEAVAGSPVCGLADAVISGVLPWWAQEEEGRTWNLSHWSPNHEAHWRGELGDGADMCTCWSLALKRCGLSELTEGCSGEGEWRFSSYHGWRGRRRRAARRLWSSTLCRWSVAYSNLNKRVFRFKWNDLEFPNQGDLDFETRIKSRILDQGNLNLTQDFEFKGRFRSFQRLEI